MSKLPSISGKQCIKALEKIGFVIYRQRGSHITMVRENPLFIIHNLSHLDKINIQVNLTK